MFSGEEQALPCPAAVQLLALKVYMENCRGRGKVMVEDGINEKTSQALRPIQCAVRRHAAHLSARQLLRTPQAQAPPAAGWAPPHQADRGKLQAVIIAKESSLTQLAASLTSTTFTCIRGRMLQDSRLSRLIWGRHPEVLLVQSAWSVGVEQRQQPPCMPAHQATSCFLPGAHAVSSRH